MIIYQEGLGGGSDILSNTEGVWNLFHASLANIFNKGVSINIRG